LADEIQTFIHASMPEWKTRYPGVEGLNVAVMGCIVNGPGESKHADIGISLPGTGEQPAAPVFIDGKKAVTLRGPTVAQDFKKLVIDYIERRYGSGSAAGRPAAECPKTDQRGVLGARLAPQERRAVSPVGPLCDRRRHCQRHSIVPH